jgi:putative endonuclease
MNCKHESLSFDSMYSTKGGHVYILTNKNHTVLYTGVTSSLNERIEQHKSKVAKGSFTSRYNCNKLVYYEGFPDIGQAIAEEKRIKGGSRKKKIALIEGMNPDWKDLWDQISRDD